MRNPQQAIAASATVAVATRSQPGMRTTPTTAAASMPASISHARAAVS